MVDKYLGVMPQGSIWYHFSRQEMIGFLQANPEMLPPGEKIDYEALESGDLQAIDVGKMEEAIGRAGLAIITLFD